MRTTMTVLWSAGNAGPTTRPYCLALIPFDPPWMAQQSQSANCFLIIGLFNNCQMNFGHIDQ
jgi:hypothetical protein